MNIEEAITKIDPILIVKYKSNSDRYFLSLRPIERVAVISLTVFYIGTPSALAYFGDFEMKIGILFSLAVSLFAIFSFYLPKTSKILTYKFILGKEEIILFTYIRGLSIMIYKTYPYSVVESYYVKSNKLSIQLDRHKIEENDAIQLDRHKIEENDAMSTHYYFGNLSGEEIQIARGVLNNNNVNFWKPWIM